MLLFPAFVAAWFLGPWELGVNMVVTTVVCLVALWPSYDNAVALGVQVGVSAGHAERRRARHLRPPRAGAAAARGDRRRCPTSTR